jgi:hypothetical protein
MGLAVMEVGVAAAVDGKKKVSDSGMQPSLPLVLDFLRFSESRSDYLRQKLV